MPTKQLPLSSARALVLLAREPELLRNYSEQRLAATAERAQRLYSELLAERTRVPYGCAAHRDAALRKLCLACRVVWNACARISQRRRQEALEMAVEAEAASLL